jgi:hypothetical protein
MKGRLVRVPFRVRVPRSDVIVAFYQEKGLPIVLRPRIGNDPDDDKASKDPVEDDDERRDDLDDDQNLKCLELSAPSEVVSRLMAPRGRSFLRRVTPSPTLLGSERLRC